jgi:hypothetical protein
MNGRSVYLTTLPTAKIIYEASATDKWNTRMRHRWTDNDMGKDQALGDTGKGQALGEKHVPVLLRFPQIINRIVWDRTHDSTVKECWVTARTMAWSHNTKLWLKSSLKVWKIIQNLPVRNSLRRRKNGFNLASKSRFLWTEFFSSMISLNSYTHNLPHFRHTYLQNVDTVWKSLPCEVPSK